MTTIRPTISLPTADPFIKGEGIVQIAKKADVLLFMDDEEEEKLDMLKSLDAMRKISPQFALFMDKTTVVAFSNPEAIEEALPLMIEGGIYFVGAILDNYTHSRSRIYGSRLAAGKSDYAKTVPLLTNLLKLEGGLPRIVRTGDPFLGRELKEGVIFKDWPKFFDGKGNPEWLTPFFEAIQRRAEMNPARSLDLESITPTAPSAKLVRVKSNHHNALLGRTGPALQALRYQSAAGRAVHFSSSILRAVGK